MNTTHGQPEGSGGRPDVGDAATQLTGAAAEWYAAVQGWRVIPLHHITPAGSCSCGNPGKVADHDRRQGGKHPVHKAWQETGTTDVGTIRSWFASRPRANVGIVTGRASGIFVLDIDPDNGGDEALLKLEAEFGDMPATWYVETGSGGGHFYYNYPDFDVTNATKALRDRGIKGIDIRGDGGQVVAAPSVSGKGPYTSTKLPVVDAPAWLLDILRPKPRTEQVESRPVTIETGRLDAYTEKALRDECELIATAVDGDQNNTINAAAFNIGQLVGAGALSESEARQALLSAARAGNHPEGRARPTIESGLRAGMAEPRRPWPPVGSDRPVSPEAVKRGVLRTPTDVSAHFSEPPDPLGGAELPDPPAIDVDAMTPPVLAAMAKSVDAHLQVPVEAPALIGISVLSTAALGRFNVADPAAGWTQPPIVRTLTTLRSGERKSDTVRIMADPVRRAGHRMWRDHEEAIEKNAAEREKIEIALEDVKSRLKKDSANTMLLTEFDALKARLAGLPDPSKNPPQLTVSDTTPEALVTALHDNDQCLGMLLAEDTLFGQVAGMYSGSPNLGIYLSSYDEEEYIVNRVGSGVRMLPTPALAIGMLVQPHVLERAATIPGARDSGFLGRWIYGVPKSRMGERTIQSPPLDEQAKHAWEQAVSRFLQMPRRPEQVPVVELGPEARADLNSFREWIEPHQREITGRYSHMTDWTGKVAGTALRLAGIYHLAAGRGFDEKVSFETMHWATSLCRWACVHAEYVHRSWRTAETKPGVDWIFQWLRKLDVSEFTRRELTRSGIARQDWYTPAALDEALAELHRTRWIASVTDEDSAGRQKATGKFIVHPAVKGGAHV